MGAEGAAEIVIAAVVLAYVVVQNVRGLGADRLGMVLRLSLLGIVLLQCVGSVSVVGFFRRDAHGESAWGTQVAPAVAAVGLAGALVLMVHNYSVLTGTTTFWINHLPWLLPCAAAAGAMVAYLSRRRARAPLT